MTDPRTIFTKAKMADVLRKENDRLREEAINSRAIIQAQGRRIAELEEQLKPKAAPLKW